MFFWVVKEKEEKEKRRRGGRSRGESRGEAERERGILSFLCVLRGEEEEEEKGRIKKEGGEKEERKKLSLYSLLLISVRHNDLFLAKSSILRKERGVLGHKKISIDVRDFKKRSIDVWDFKKCHFILKSGHY